MPAVPPPFDIVADLERPEDDQQNTCRKIGQGALQGQTDGQARGTQNRDERCGLYAELVQSGNDHKGQQGHIAQAGDKLGQCTVHIPSGHESADQIADPTGDPASDDENDERGKNPNAICGQQRGEFGCDR